MSPSWKNVQLVGRAVRELLDRERARDRVGHVLGLDVGAVLVLEAVTQGEGPLGVVLVGRTEVRGHVGRQDHVVGLGVVDVLRQRPGDQVHDRGRVRVVGPGGVERERDARRPARSPSRPAPRPRGPHAVPPASASLPAPAPPPASADGTTSSGESLSDPPPHAASARSDAVAITATADFFSRIRVFPTFLGLIDDALGRCQSHRRVLGSKASRMASPSRLSATTRKKIPSTGA